MADTDSVNVGTNSSTKLSWINRSVVLQYKEDPMTYPRPLKWFITILLAAAALIDPMSYAMLYPALPEIPVDLHTTESIANLASSLSLIGPAIMPLYWGSMAERVGRRITYIVSISLFILFAGLSGAMHQIKGLIVTRVLGSFCGCAVTVVGGAVIADIWDVQERGSAMGIYYIGIYMAPALGPLIGGALVYAWDWRAIQWFLTIYGGIVLLLLFFCLPETLRKSHEPVVVATHDRNASGKDEPDNESLKVHLSSTSNPQQRVWYRQILFGVLGPLKAFAYFRYPAITLTIYLASVNLAALIMLATSIQYVFSHAPYNYNYLIVGLLYIPMPLGIIPGGVIGGKWSDKVMDRAARSTANQESDAKPIGQYPSAIVHKPEDRLQENGWISVVLLPLALIFFGWTVHYHLIWVVPMIPWFMSGIAAGLIFGLVTTMLVEYVPPRSATMVALNSFGRNLLSAVSGSITQPLIDSIGNGWLFTAAAIFASANILVVAALRKHGRAWRQKIDHDEKYVRTAKPILPMDGAVEAAFTKPKPDIGARNLDLVKDQDLIEAKISI